MIIAAIKEIIEISQVNIKYSCFLDISTRFEANKQNTVCFCSRQYYCGWLVKPNQSSKLYTSLFIYMTLASPLRLPSDQSQKTLRVHLNVVGCVTDMQQQPMRSEGKNYKEVSR